LLIVDESLSQAPGVGAGDDVQPWVLDIVDRLEQKLKSRGVGNVSPNNAMANRYAVIGFGNDGDPVDLKQVEGSSSPWVDSGSVDNLLAQFANSGSNSEVAFNALTEALGVDDLWSQNGMDVPPLLEFRANAAVQVIVVTDEVNEEEPILYGPTVGEPDCDVEETCRNLFFELVNELQAPNLDTEDVPALPALKDAVVTMVAPFDFDESRMNAGANRRIFGVDVHILDQVNVDKNASVANDPTVQNLAGDIVASTSDNFVIFHGDDTEQNGNVIADVRTGVTAGEQLLDAGVDYQTLRSEFANPFGTVDNIQQNFNAEDYAFFTWEARGTAWDFEVIRGKYDHETFELINGSSTSLGEQFNKAFVDDVFEKIRLQITDFDNSGRVSLAGEFNAYWAAALTLIDSNPNNNANPRNYDLDGDGSFVGVGANGPEVDLHDVKILVQLMATRFGDSNFDYEYNSSDFVTVFQAGEYRDATQNNSTWAEGDWNGNFDFDTDDFVLVEQMGGYEQSYVDANGDGKADVLPIWAFNLTFSGDDTAFYLVTWADV
jgi:hypothetical protein